MQQNILNSHILSLTQVMYMCTPHACTPHACTPHACTVLYRCVNYQEAVNTLLYSECVPFISGEKCNFFDYGTNFVELQDTLQRFSNYVQMQAVSNYCEEVVMSYVCNYVYPGCDDSQEVPVGICREECVQFVARGECMDIFERLESAATLVETFHIDTQCMSLNRYGFNHTADPLECFNISGMR